MVVLSYQQTTRSVSQGVEGGQIKHPCHGFRRAWRRCATTSAVRSTGRSIHRLWHHERLQLKVTSCACGLGSPPCCQIAVSAPNMVWANDFQFDSTEDGESVKNATMIDEHTRELPLNLVEPSATGEALVKEPTTVLAANGGSPKVPRMNNGPEMFSTALQRFCGCKTGTVYSPPGCIGTTATSNRSPQLPAQGVVFARDRGGIGYERTAVASRCGVHSEAA